MPLGGDFFAAEREKLNELVRSVKEDGAVGDGVTNDAASIQGTIDAVFAAGGGIAWLPQGTYLVSDLDADGHALELKTGVTLMGAGVGVSIIFLAANENDTGVLHINTSQTDIRICDLTIDGNRANQGTPNGNLTGIDGSNNVARVWIHDCEIKNVYGRSIMTNEEGAAGDPDTTLAENFFISEVYLRNCGAKAVQVRRTKNAVVENCIAEVNQVSSDGIFEASLSKHVAFNNCVSRTDVSGFGIAHRIVNGSQNITICGSTAEDVQSGLFLLDSSNVAVVGCNFAETQDGGLIQHIDASGIGHPVPTNIQIVGCTFRNPNNDGLVVDVDSGNNGTAINDLLISGCTFHDDGSNVMDYGIRLNPQSGTITAREFGNVFTNAQVADTSGTFAGIGISSEPSIKTATGAKLTLQTSKTAVVDGDTLGQIDFQAPDEASGTDAILVGASIKAEADDTFAADNNTTDLAFLTAESEAATEKMRLTGSGVLGVGTENPKGAGIHVQNTDLSPSISTAADELILENADNCGFSVITNDTGTVRLFFGNALNPAQGRIQYRPNVNDWQLWAGNVERMVITQGVQIGSPTGGDKGSGTLNAESGVYDNNTRLTDIVQEAVARKDGKIDVQKWHDSVPDVIVEDEDRNGEFIKGRHVPKEHKEASLLQEMMDNGFKPWDRKNVVQWFRDKGTLPGMPSASDWEHSKYSLGEMASRSWMAKEIVMCTMCCLADELDELEKRVAALEKRKR